MSRIIKVINCNTCPYRREAFVFGEDEDGNDTEETVNKCIHTVPNRDINTLGVISKFCKLDKDPSIKSKKVRLHEQAQKN
jgi:hypothetical protein